MVRTHACGTTAVALALATLLKQGVNTRRRRASDKPAATKAGRGRTQPDPASGPRAARPVDHRRVAPTRDATSRGAPASQLSVRWTM